MLFPYQTMHLVAFICINLHEAEKEDNFDALYQVRTLKEARKHKMETLRNLPFGRYEAERTIAKEIDRIDERLADMRYGFEEGFPEMTFDALKDWI